MVAHANLIGHSTRERLYLQLPKIPNLRELFPTSLHVESHSSGSSCAAVKPRLHVVTDQTSVGEVSNVDHVVQRAHGYFITQDLGSHLPTTNVIGPRHGGREANVIGKEQAPS
jgi:hypothetical protein